MSEFDCEPCPSSTALNQARLAACVVGVLAVVAFLTFYTRAGARERRKKTMTSVLIKVRRARAVLATVAVMGVRVVIVGTF